MTQIDQKLLDMGQRAQAAANALRTATTPEKNQALEAMADQLLAHSSEIITANEKDQAAGRENGLAEPMIERLLLDQGRIEGMAQGIRKIAALADPTSVSKASWTIENGLRITERTVPLGVLAMIYESRPNVTSDASALALKAGNAIILRGGKEALNSNLAIEKALKEGLKTSAIPEDAIQVIPNADREYSNQLMRMDQYVDVLIPRGSAGLIQSVKQQATVPVIETGVGNDHVYIEKTADPDMAKKILANAKVQRPSVCNAAETVIIDRDFAEAHLKDLVEPLRQAGVQLVGDLATQELLGSEVQEATDEDYATEYLDLTLAVKIVDSYAEALDHLQRFSTGHSEAIVTSDYQVAQDFLNDVDAAAVYVNASTRFTDGEVFGFGGEIGISTQKLHARGPMGLEALTTSKFVIEGSGQVRE